MTDREIFKENLNRLLSLSGCSQVDLARFVGAKKSTVSGWTRGISYPRADAMEKISIFFGVPLSAVVDKVEKTDTEEDQLIRIFRSLSSNGKRLMLERAHELVILYGKKSASFSDSQTG